MPPLQPYVSNVPLQVAKNLRFNDDNGIPVTQMLPIGMNGNVVNDNPKTGYISRTAAILSDQIDLYNQVVATLDTYGQDITILQQQVQALQISGTTIPFVNGHCFTGNANSPITTVVQLMAESACDYNAVLGTSSALTAAILAEGASALNVMAAFSQASAMAGLSGWISNPLTTADTITNLWLSYLDSRAGVSDALSQLTPSCSQAVVNFAANYTAAQGTGSGFSIFFSGYSFIPAAYTDNGSTITIQDGVGGIYTTGIDLIARSQPGANDLFVGISGTALSTTVPSYTVTLNGAIKSSSNTCTKTVIHTISGSGQSSSGSGSGTTSSFPKVVANNDILVQTSGTTVVQYTTTTTGTFLIGGYATILSISGYTLQLNIGYTDQNGTARSTTLNSRSAIGVMYCGSETIRVQGGTTITVSTALTSSGSISYDVGATVTQLV